MTPWAYRSCRCGGAAVTAGELRASLVDAPPPARVVRQVRRPDFFGEAPGVAHDLVRGTFLGQLRVVGRELRGFLLAVGGDLLLELHERVDQAEIADCD